MVPVGAEEDTREKAPGLVGLGWKSQCPPDGGMSLHPLQFRLPHLAAETPISPEMP